MTGMVLFLMAHEMIGQVAHEWLGIGIFVLFVMQYQSNITICFLSFSFIFAGHNDILYDLYMAFNL